MTPGELREEARECPTHRGVMEVMLTRLTAQAVTRNRPCPLGRTEQAQESATSVSTTIFLRDPENRMGRKQPHKC